MFTTFPDSIKEKCYFASLDHIKMLSEILQYTKYGLSFHEIEGMQGVQTLELPKFWTTTTTTTCTALLFNISSKLIWIGKIGFRFDNLMSAKFDMLKYKM